MTFDWDEAKDRINIKKHGINFETATRVFNDSFRIELYDKDHSCDEERYITIGEVCGRPLVISVTYTERKEVIRLISARKATAREKRLYYDYKKRD